MARYVYEYERQFEDRIVKDANFAALDPISFTYTENLFQSICPILNSVIST